MNCDFTFNSPRCQFSQSTQPRVTRTSELGKRMTASPCHRSCSRQVPLISFFALGGVELFSVQLLVRLYRSEGVVRNANFGVSQLGSRHVRVAHLVYVFSELDGYFLNSEFREAAGLRGLEDGRRQEVAEIAIVEDHEFSLEDRTYSAFLRHPPA